MTAVVGPNGAGKSTLIKAIMGDISPVGGQIRLSSQARSRMACMPQAETLDRSFPITVYDLVALGAWSQTGAWRGLDSACHERTVQALERTGLAALAGRIVGTLSGGQLQRALFARLLMYDAHVLLLDEPFAAVDRATTDALLSLLSALNREGRTIIVVLHDLDVVRSWFPMTLMVAGEMVGWGATSQVLTPENIERARQLCAAPSRQGEYL